MPRASWARAVRARSVAGAELGSVVRIDVGGQAEDRLGAGIGAVDDQPRRGAHPVDDVVLAVVHEHFASQRADGETQPGAQEAGERRIDLLEGGVPLAQGPDRCGPASRRRPSRTDRAARPESGWGSGCRRVASTARRCRRPARRPSAGTSARAAARTPRCGWPRRGTGASAAGRRPRPGPRRRRRRRPDRRCWSPGR